MSNLITPPTAEPVAVSVAKQNCHVDSDQTGEDVKFARDIAAARDVAEIEAGPSRAIVYQTREVVLDSWPDDEWFISLPYPPIRQIVSVKYKDPAGVEYTWDSSNYFLDKDSEPGRLILAYEKTWPADVILYPANAIRVRYRAGYTIPYTVNATTNIITALGHPFVDGEALPYFSNTGGAIPTGLIAKTTYYARDVSGDTLKVAAAVDGVAIDITTAGTGTNFIGEVPERIVNGILLLVNYWFENREAAEQGADYNAIPFGIKSMFQHEPKFPSI